MRSATGAHLTQKTATLATTLQTGPSTLQRYMKNGSIHGPLNVLLVSLAHKHSIIRNYAQVSGNAHE